MGKRAAVNPPSFAIFCANLKLDLSVLFRKTAFAQQRNDGIAIARMKNMLPSRWMR